MFIETLVLCGTCTHYNSVVAAAAAAVVVVVVVVVVYVLDV
jgi:hypothetical protein